MYLWSCLVQLIFPSCLQRGQGADYRFSKGFWMFKNMIVYRIAEGWQGDLQVLEDALQKTVFEECGATQERSVGWVHARRAAWTAGRKRGRAMGDALHERIENAARQRAQSQGQ